MKFTALVATTIQSAVPNAPIQGPSGSVKVAESGSACTRPTVSAKTRATTIWRTSLVLAPRSTTSSSAPSRARPQAVPTVAATAFSPWVTPGASAAATAAPKLAPAAIARPPDVGVGRLCEPRSRGGSTGPLQATRQDSRALTTAAAVAPTQKAKITRPARSP